MGDFDGHVSLENSHLMRALASKAKSKADDVPIEHRVIMLLVAEVFVDVRGDIIAELERRG